ncbi:monovalent cation/H(+) antiporter subunit G [Geovibrio sp. ADMFC3]|jgi:multicomponent Na+:H+ antiporter subunit G|nr:cation:proton antiporter [Deferribacteraceae bacterium]
MEIRMIISGFLIFAGCFFIVVASLGVLRLPDFYARLHAGGKADTMGQTLVVLGLIVYEGFNILSLKMLFVIIFIYIANPTATHAIAKAAWVEGLKPWRKKND